MEQGLQQKYELAKRAYADLQKLQWIDELYFPNAHQAVIKPETAFGVLSKLFEEPKAQLKSGDAVEVADNLVRTLDKTIEYLSIIRLQFQVQLEGIVRDYNGRMVSLGKSFYQLMAQRAIENLPQAINYARSHGISLSGNAGTKKQSSDKQEDLDLLGKLAIATAVPEGDYKKFEEIIIEYNGILDSLTALSERIKDTSLDSTRLDSILLSNILNDGFDKKDGVTINRLKLDLETMKSGKYILDGLR